jgi:hypothetical protein
MADKLSIEEMQALMAQYSPAEVAAITKPPSKAGNSSSIEETWAFVEKHSPDFAANLRELESHLEGAREKRVEDMMVRQLQAKIGEHFAELDKKLGVSNPTTDGRISVSETVGEIRWPSHLALMPYNMIQAAYLASSVLPYFDWLFQEVPKRFPPGSPIWTLTYMMRERAFDQDFLESLLKQSPFTETYDISKLREEYLAAIAAGKRPAYPRNDMADGLHPDTPTPPQKR